MPYSSFSLSKVQSQFGLKVEKGAFFTEVPPLIPRQRVLEAIERILGILKWMVEN